MRIIHWVKKEDSGLFKTASELAGSEEKLGHEVSIRTPSDMQNFYGFSDNDFQIHCIHSQIPPMFCKDSKPKILFLHGEPDYGMMVKSSISAVLDLSPMIDAMIAFNPAEAQIWSSFKRVYTISKGINLNVYKPKDVGKKLKGSPAVLYCEHWRSFRHPLHVLVAMEKVSRINPEARLYLFGCPPEEKDFWMRLLKHNRYNLFTPGLFQPQSDMPTLLNLADIIVSPVYPSYGRVSLEALASGKPVVAYNTNPHATYKCEPYNIDDMASKILKCWEEKPSGQREYAEEYLDCMKMAEQAIGIYKRFI